ncbi:MAG: tripartite tricarboxylate transporter substrate binding protein [Dehalobacterium sp.]
MFNVKKVLILLVLVSFVFSLAVGCGQNETPSTNNAKLEENKEQVPEEKFPTRPIEFIVPWGPGGGADQLARILAKELEGILEVSFPVINMAGAAGAVGMEKLITAPNDGYALAAYTLDTHATLSGQNPSFNFEDIIPVARMMKVPSYIFVSYDSPYKTWEDFERAVKENPGQVKVAITGDGTVDDLTLTFLEDRHDLKVNKVPFPNPGERYVSILGGHADALFEQSGDVAQYLDQNQMRPIIVFNEKRTAEYPDVPCTGELGMEVYLPFSRTIVAKAGTDMDKINTLSEGLKKAYQSQAFQEFLVKNRAAEDSFMGPAEATKALEEDLVTMRAILEN